MARHALRTVEFKVLLRLLRQAPAVRVGSPTEFRRFLHGVHYFLRTGIPRRDLPRRFGHWNSIFRHYRRWCLVGVWERLVAACTEERRHQCRVYLDTTDDTTHVHSHPVSAGARLDQGGLLACLLTPGQAGGRPLAEALLEGIQPGHVLADQSYDADNLRRYIAALGAEPVMPGRRNRRLPIDYERTLYRERNIVEHSIGWLK